MRVPRVWFTVRRLMVAVALLSVLLGLVARRERLLRLSTYHAEQSHRTMIVQQSNLPAVVDSAGAHQPGAYLFPTPRSNWTSSSASTSRSGSCPGGTVWRCLRSPSPPIRRSLLATLTRFGTKSWTGRSAGPSAAIRRYTSAGIRRGSATPRQKSFRVVKPGH
jgi:hypothetical protein